MSESLSATDKIEADRQQFCRALDSIALPVFGCGKRSGPKVIALEGPNATGKSTLGKALSMRLQAPSCLGTDAAWFSEPFKTRMIRDADWHASALFFLSGCFEQMRLLRGRPEALILMDRSIWSTLAVHAATDVERLRALAAVLSPLAECIDLPEKTLVLDASFATCQARIAKKSGLDRALDELTANALFHMREREFYRWLERRVPGVVFLNVDQISADAAVDQAATLLQKVSC